MTKALLFGILGFLLFSAAAAADIDGLTREELDTDKDGKPDKIVYKDDGGRIRRQEWDLDGQHKTMDFFYDKDMKIESALSDTNNDGTNDVQIKYRNGLMSEVSRDKNEDGKPEYWSFYQGGVLEHSEVDTNNDGRADEWFYYVGNQVVRKEKDANFDGKPDNSAAYKGGKLVIEQDTDFDGKTDRKSI